MKKELNFIPPLRHQLSHILSLPVKVPEIFENDSMYSLIIG